MTSTRFLYESQVECGKKALCTVDKPCTVGVHDVTRCSLTPSVTVIIDIPESIEGSFFKWKSVHWRKRHCV